MDSFIQHLHDDVYTSAIHCKNKCIFFIHWPWNILYPPKLYPPVVTVHFHNRPDFHRMQLIYKSDNDQWPGHLTGDILEHTSSATCISSPLPCQEQVGHNKDMLQWSCRTLAFFLTPPVPPAFPVYFHVKTMSIELKVVWASASRL